MNEPEHFLKALLDKFPQQAMQSIDSWAPQQMVDRVKALAQIESKPLQSFFITPKEILSRLHSSWFEDVVASCPASFQELGIRAMQEEMEVVAKTFSDSIRGFLLQQVLSQWPERSITQTVLSELPFLHTCSAEEVTTLVELISVYDLVDSVRKIVEKKKLQAIFSRLSALQQKYLKELLQGKKFHCASSFDCTAFLQLNPQEAMELLHREGLKKLGEVLTNEDASIYWTVIHSMDKKFARYIQEGKDMKKASTDMKQLTKKFIHAFQFVQR